MMPTPYIKNNMFRSLILVLCFGISFLSISSLSAFAADGQVTLGRQQSAKAQGAGSGSAIRLNFIDADISVVIQFIAELTGKNFIIDNNIRGKVTIISPKMISVDEAYMVFESVLEVNGFAAVPSGKVIKIVPSTEARSKNIETRVTDAEGNVIEDKLITQLIPLTYADSNTIKMLFTPLVGKTSMILSYPDTNTLIVTDVSSNIKRLQHIISAIDVPGIGKEVSIIPLEYANAEKLATKLTSVFRAQAAAEKGAVQKTLQFVADERTNTVIFVASEEDTVRIKQVITLLDQDTPKGKGNIRVYYLEHATAEDMAKVLEDLPKGKSAGEGSTVGKNAPVLSDQINISFDKATNSLIIMADSEDYLVLEEIIKKLDIPRSMVYIESMIMEVNVESGFELGVEWSAAGDVELGGDEGVIGGTFSNNDSGGISPTQFVSPYVPNGLNVGILTGGVTLTTSAGTFTIPSLGALIKAVETEKDVHILSTPRLLTTDNEEATIVVGSNIPYQTKISTTSTGNETFNSYEYKNVGLTLKITPHISGEDRMVRLKISQELTALTDASGTVSSTPTTLNRSVETTVIVRDQEMLVIGGLIDDSITNTVSRVPILGRIPLLGRLFRYNSKSGRKTNLYLFITPRVVKNPAEARKLLSDTTEKMTPVETGLVKLYGPTTDEGNDDPAIEANGSEK